MLRPFRCDSVFRVGFRSYRGMRRWRSLDAKIGVPVGLKVREVLVASNTRFS